MSIRAIRIDRAACRGSGACATRAPASFRLDAEHRSQVIDPAGDPEATVRAAAAACPAFAITLEEEDG
ncbi:MAG: ferredoxin [Myxococcota bacterium]